MDNFDINSLREEDKTTEHYNFLKSGFGEMYIKEADFLKRDDLYVYCLRNDEGKLIAASLCRLGFTKTKRTPIMRVMFVSVLDEYKGNGLNTKFNKYIQMECEHFGCRKMVCNIKANNTASIISFLKSGFVISNKNSEPYKDGTKKLFLVKKI